jgi:hypothetical protein
MSCLGFAFSLAPKEISIGLAILFVGIIFKELFQERGDAVTPKQLATPMEQKLHRHAYHTFATYLFTLLGFTTRVGIGQENKSGHCIIFKAELYSEKHAYFSRDLGKS